MNGNWMTVGELIEHLRTMPPDAVCIYQACSEFHELQASDVKMSTAAEQAKEAALRREYDDIIVKRFGQYARYEPYHWPEGSAPEFVSVCRFPGN